MSPQRWLAAVSMLGVAILAGAEARSPLAAAIRSRRPWTAQLTRGESQFILVYQPALRRVDVVLIPENFSWSELGLAAAPPTVTEPREEEDDGEPPVSAARDLAPRSARRWLRLIKTLGSSGPGEAAAFDRLLLALEAARVDAAGLRPAYLPTDETQRQAFLKDLLEPDASRPPAPASIAVEVLNASERKGIASEATKVLRSNGADVVHVGNVSSRRRRTIVYDRTGRIENALWTRERLRCPADVVTQIDAKRLVDVTVVLSDDCGL